MAICARYCIASSYFFNAYNMIKEQNGGIQGQEIVRGPLKELADRKRIELGISHAVRLVTLPNANRVFINGQYPSHFGNTIFPGSPAIAIPERHDLNEREIEYLIVEQACKLKTNQTFLSQMAAIILGIAIPLLLFPSFSTASLILGALAGIAAKYGISKLLTEKTLELVKKHANREQIQSGIGLYRRINQRLEEKILKPIRRYPALFFVDWLLSDLLTARNEHAAATLESDHGGAVYRA